MSDGKRTRRPCGGFFLFRLSSCTNITQRKGNARFFLKKVIHGQVSWQAGGCGSRAKLLAWEGGVLI